MRCWRHVYDLAQEIPPETRSDLVEYALGAAALMLRRETEGLERLEEVSRDSTWWTPAYALRLTGHKRRALRAFQTLGWNEVVEALNEVLRMDEEDEAVRTWLERASVFAMLYQRNPEHSETLTAQWRERLRRQPKEIRPLHQWAVYAYWDAQENPSPERWRYAMSLWGTLINLEEYWMEWVIERLQRHDPVTWADATEADGPIAQRVREMVGELRREMSAALTADMTDSILRHDSTTTVLDDLLLEFLRESQTAMLWREWLDANSSLQESVLPYGGDLLSILGRLGDVINILTTTVKLQPTASTERLLIYLSPLGSLLAAAETSNERLAQERARRLFNSPDPIERRNARIIFVIATRQTEALFKNPRKGLEATLTAMVCSREVGSSPLMTELDWAPLLTRLSDRIVAEVESLTDRTPETRIEGAAAARDLLKRAYEATQIAALIHAIVRVITFEVRAHVALGKRGRRAADDPYFGEHDVEALNLLQEGLALSPNHVTLQQEAAQLRLRRGLVAARDGRINEALIDFARAHELDPVSHRVTATYSNFMMEQAARVWMEQRADAQREALSLAHRVLSANPTDPQLLSRCSRFLDLPENHPLRETPEYRRLATLFLRHTNESQ
jgi:hypothetical protein